MPCMEIQIGQISVRDLIERLCHQIGQAERDFTLGKLFILEAQ